MTASSLMYVFDLSAPAPGSSRPERLAASLEANRLAPELLYLTPRQTALWREVFLRHSPVHANPEFQRLYRDAFAQVAAQQPPGPVHLVGLGCGTGLKEAELCRHLRAAGHEVFFSALDISEELVRESSVNVTVAGGIHRRSRIGDITDPALPRWLDEHTLPPRVYTFFGLVPNLPPAVFADIFTRAVRPGDILLVSANLVPVMSDDPAEIPAALATILPQYDNPETRAWLGESIRELQLDGRVEPSVFRCEFSPVAACIVAESAWKDEPSRPPLRVFTSARYTPAQFETVLRSSGFQLKRLGLTACRQEGIWSVQKPTK